MVAAMYMVTRDGKAAWKHSLRGLAVRLQHSWIREVSSTLQAFRVLLGQMLITLSLMLTERVLLELLGLIIVPEIDIEMSRVDW
jgi:hypothetical protein